MKINVHYCGGKLKLLSFACIDEQDQCCGKKMKRKNCCKDKTAVLKVDDTHKSTQSLKVPIPAFQPLDIAIHVLPLNFYSHFNALHIRVSRDDPPDINGPDIYVRNQVFLI
jgi:hypothetical protein